MVLLLRDSTIKTEILATLKAIETSFTNHHHHFLQCLRELDSRIAHLTNTTPSPPLTLQQHPTTPTNEVLLRKFEIEVPLAAVSPTHVGLAIAEPLPPSELLGMFQMPSPKLKSYPQNDAAIATVSTALEMELHHLEVDHCINNKTNSDIQEIVQDSTNWPEVIAFDHQRLNSSTDFNYDGHYSVTSNFFNLLPVTRCSPSSLFPPSGNISARCSKWKDYFSITTSHFPVLMLPKCWYIGCSVPIPQLFYARAIIPWIEEPPGTIFLEYITFLKIDFSFEDWNQLLFRKESCCSLSSFSTCGDKHLYPIEPLVICYSSVICFCKSIGICLPKFVIFLVLRDPSTLEDVACVFMGEIFLSENPSENQKKMSLNRTLFGDYDVIYIAYQGIPTIPSSNCYGKGPAGSIGDHQCTFIANFLGSSSSIFFIVLQWHNRIHSCFLEVSTFPDDFKLAFISETCALMVSDLGKSLICQITLKTEDCISGSVLGTKSVWLMGMGSDLFGSDAESSRATLVVASITSFWINHELTAMLYPLLFCSIELLICLINNLFATDLFEFKVVKENEAALKKQFIISTSLMTLGMLTIATGQAMYGQISDNVGGFAEMAGMRRRVQVRTDALDAAENTTVTSGKGFAMVKDGVPMLLRPFRGDQSAGPLPKDTLQAHSVLTPVVIIGLRDMLRSRQDQEASFDPVGRPGTRKCYLGRCHDDYQGFSASPP